MLGLGIDIGGSGIKGAVIDTETGSFETDRIRISTPRPATADAVLATLEELIVSIGWKEGPIGIGFPGVIRRNRIESAVNLDDSLVGISLADTLRGSGFRQVRVLNDADAAGFAEMEFGAGRPHLDEGSVLMLTIGTGIGTAMFVNGQLVPNLELGHIHYKKHHAESYLSERARLQQEWSLRKWGKRFNKFLVYLEFLLQPDLIVLGGGGVKNPEEFEEFIQPKTPWSLAHAGNRAGIIGAALAACRKDYLGTAS